MVAADRRGGGRRGRRAVGLGDRATRPSACPAPAPWRSRRDAWSGDAWTSVANRNNNPLNVKLGARTQWYVEAGVARPSDIIPRDGGRFLKFDSPEAGFRAAADLLTARLLEDGGLDRALRRWSNNGYGAEIVAGTSFEARRGASGVGRDDLRILLNAMAAAEGYRSAALANEVERALKD